MAEAGRAEAGPAGVRAARRMHLARRGTRREAVAATTHRARGDVTAKRFRGHGTAAFASVLTAVAENA